MSKKFTFKTSRGWDYTMFAKNKKEAINRFAKEIGPGVAYEIVEG